MSSIMRPTNLEFVLFRHGHSLANQENRIVSSLEHGTRTTGGPLGTGFGLSDKGRQEVVESVTSLWKHISDSTLPGKASTVRIVASPFIRACQTAQIIHEELQKKASGSVSVRSKVVENPQLRERFFGHYELQTDSDRLYRIVWEEDAKSQFQSEHNVESVARVTERMTSVVREFERERDDDTDPFSEDPEEWTNKTDWVILVSHGDSLQILQAAMKGWSGDRHRQVEHLNTAEWRHVRWCEALRKAHDRPSF